MIERLLEIVKTDLLTWLDDPSKWDSLVINRRKPHTYRVFTQINWKDRICLHKFNPCDTHEAFLHPHGWPAAFLILHGSYRMILGSALDHKANPWTSEELILNKGSAYSILSPLTFHSITPLEECYTVMINGYPFNNPHSQVRTTKGKDLEKMQDKDLVEHLHIFKYLVKEYNKPKHKIEGVKDGIS